MIFKEKHSKEKRQKESSKLRAKYDSRIPVIVECNGDIQVSKYKFLVPKDLTLAQFLIVIRKRTTLKAEEALYVFFNGSLASASSLISVIDKEHRDEDGFLYATVSKETTFG